ncbi:MAG: CPBP family intramembrane metalloprotease [Anaerolineae bacterium]|nr:CPBP family intramembrane metalloprotease [Anaerolineae bacterium]
MGECLTPVLVGLALLGVVGLIVVGQNIAALTWLQVSDDIQVNQRLSYQVITFGMALAYLGVVYAVRPQVRLLGVGDGESWRSVGLSFTFWVSVATGAFLYLNVVQPLGLGVEALLANLPVVLVLATLNAFTEEALTRFGVVVGLHGVVHVRWVYLVSALVFGLPHYFGVPGGVVGALMSGVLGWLLARSLVETRGVFWAWFIHFVQDVLIFSVLLAAA